jgi:hypothetical protein
VPAAVVMFAAWLSPPIASPSIVRSPPAVTTKSVSEFETPRRKPILASAAGVECLRKSSLNVEIAVIFPGCKVVLLSASFTTLIQPQLIGEELKLGGSRSSSHREAAVATQHLQSHYGKFAITLLSSGGTE